MNWSQASGRQDIELALRKIGGQKDEEIDIAGAALLLAALDRPRVGLDRYHHHLSLLSRDVADHVEKAGGKPSLEERIAIIAQVLFKKYEYQGDEASYDDLQNVNLMRVIDRRKGMPVSLAILFLHVARSQGWKADGIGFPGHFLVRMDMEGQRVLIDPFNGGRQIEPPELRELLKLFIGGEAELQPEHYAPVGNRAILLRLQNNIKVRLLQDRQSEGALEAVETMLMIAPAQAELWQEAGILHAGLENLRAALFAFERHLELEGNQEARFESARLMSEIKSRLN